MVKKAGGLFGYTYKDLNKAILKKNLDKARTILNHKKFKKKSGRDGINDYSEYRRGDNVLPVWGKSHEYIPALHLAVWMEHFPMVKLLLDHPMTNINLKWNPLVAREIRLGKHGEQFINTLYYDPQYAINLSSNNPEITQLFLKHSKFKKKTMDPEFAEEWNRMIDNKKKIKDAKEKMKKQAKGQKERSKKAAEKAKKERKKNKQCKNDIEFILQEDIDEFEPDELYNIHLEGKIYCLEKSSFLNMLIHSQQLLGDCKQLATRDKGPQGCMPFFPVNIGFNVYIDHMDHKRAIAQMTNKGKDIKSWELRNKKLVDFTTGLHRVSEKTGKDYVYKLVAKFKQGGKKKAKKVRKHKGVNQKTGRLNKGYKYSGKKLKSGLPQIIKIKKN